MKLANLFATVVLLPLALVVSVATIGAGQAAEDAAAAGAGAAACTYGDPDPERIALTMAQLSDPVDEQRWDTYAADAGINPDDTNFASSTAAQRQQVLVAGIRTLSYTVSTRTVASPVVVWWGAELPESDDDLAWQSVFVPGYGRLGDYIVAYLNEYAINPVVLASVESTSCAPANGRCQAPDDISPILATIRFLESRGDYTAQAAGSTASGAYQFVDGTWDNFNGYARAVDAPPEVQDAKATAMVISILERNRNDVAAVPVVWYIGHLPDVGSSTWDEIPVPDAGNVLTPREYQTRWVERFLEFAGPEASTCPTPQAITDLAGPDCDGLRGTGATYNGRVNGTLRPGDLPSSRWGPLQPAGAEAWAALIDAGIADGWTAADFAGWSGGPGSRNGGYSNHTIGLAIDINQLAWTPTRSVPGEPLPVAYAFDEPFYQWMRNNAWRYGWCNPRALRPLYLNGSATGGRAADGTGRYLEPWHFEFVGGSTHFNSPRPGDLNGPLGIPD